MATKTEAVKTAAVLVKVALVYVMPPLHHSRIRSNAYLCAEHLFVFAFDSCCLSALRRVQYILYLPLFAIRFGFTILEQLA